MALGEDGFERFNFLLEGVQTSHLRNNLPAGQRVPEFNGVPIFVGTKYGQNNPG